MHCTITPHKFSSVDRNFSINFTNIISLFYKKKKCCAVGDCSVHCITYFTRSICNIDFGFCQL